MKLKFSWGEIGIAASGADHGIILSGTLSEMREFHRCLGSALATFASDHPGDAAVHFLMNPITPERSMKATVGRRR